MSYKLEQGVYFTSHAGPAGFETAAGLGLTAASRTDQDTLREMRKIAAQTTFYGEQTEYSFLYSETLGFCTAATTVRVSPRDSRPTPYIHMIFSGKHPEDDAGEYGFSAQFQTGTAELEGVLAPVEAEPLPDWNPFRAEAVTARQLAWLIYRLWLVLIDSNSVPLLLSPDGFPPEWEKPLRLMGAMSRLAELLPACLRKSLRGTTAAATDTGRFPVRFSDCAEAVSLKNLPVLEPREGGYFEELCVRMAESCLNNREEFFRLCGRIDQQALCRLEQTTVSRLTLAVCCVTAVPQCAWTLNDATMRAVYESVKALLPNQYRDQAFWQEQEAVLRRNIPPDNPDNDNIEKILQNTGLRALVMQWPPALSREQMELWYRRLDTLLNECQDAGGLDKQDMKRVARTAVLLDQMDWCTLARRLCWKFLTACCPTFRDMWYLSEQSGNSFNACIRRHIETLAETASLQDLYQYVSTDPAYPVRCPGAAWFKLTSGERLDILKELELSDSAYPYYEKLFAPGSLFCGLLRRLFGPDSQDRILQEPEEDMLFECLAEAAREILENQAFSQTLKIWRQVQPQPSISHCGRLARQMQTASPPLNRGQLEQVWRAWDHVFEGSKNMLKKQWRREKKKKPAKNAGKPYTGR